LIFCQSKPGKRDSTSYLGDTLDQSRQSISILDK
jgi:hypothetical protein